MWINGGYFVLRREIFDYIEDGEELVLEPFERLAAKDKLGAHRHNGFWTTMDTIKDKQVLDEMYQNGDRPWCVWESARAGDATVNLLFDSDWADDARRSAVYGGDVLVFSPSAPALALVALARELLEAAFAPHHPTEAQYHVPVADYAAVLADVKPAFIHDPRASAHPAARSRRSAPIPTQMYFDVPRMRSATAHDTSTSGISYAFHPHRDTWYSAPQAQINWWFPIYEMEPGNGMAFHPRYFAHALPNSSETYNYYRWNLQNRATAASQVDTDTRVQPRLDHRHRPDDQVRVCCRSAA